MRFYFFVLFALFFIFFGFGKTCFANDNIFCVRKNRNLSYQRFKINIIQYQANNKPYTVIILPPNGGRTMLDENYAYAICQRNINVIILNNWTGRDKLFLNLSSHQAYFEHAIHILVAVINYSGANQIGLLGTSAGGIIAAIATHLLPIVKKTFVIAGGADIPSIIVYSNSEKLVKLKKARRRAFGFVDDQEYLNALRVHFYWDPLDLPLYRSSKKLGMLTVAHDVTVPTYYQNLLLDLWKPDLVIHYKRSFLGELIYDNHIGAILEGFLSFNRDVVDFF